MNHSQGYTFFYTNVFSQWHLCSFEENGIMYNCAEQYMMYQKALLFKDTNIADQILQAKHPSQQKALGRKVRNFDLQTWNASAKDIVYQGNYCKFTQNEDLKNALLKTGNTLLVEASPYDCIWGIGLGMNDPERLNYHLWKGTNWLGEVLTKLRNDLRNPSFEKVN